jgi:endonuclease/exonuclease/phosphatase family metal-dependent hydrolase
LPKAILGDMNTEPDLMEIQLLETQFTDAYTGAGADAPGYTFRADDPHERIDYIFTSAELTPLEARVGDDSQASDHRPVIARVRITL